jgi:hypothetical protein
MPRNEVTLADDRNQLAAIMTAFDGGRIANVHYLMPVGAEWPNGRRHDQVHEVDLGVEIVLDSGIVVSIFWAMTGELEGLSLSVRAGDGTSTPSSLTQAIDATGLEQWRSLLGGSLTLDGAATHLPEEGNREAIWSVRLGASQSDSVVVALGEASEQGLAYLPDSLVVIFDDGISQSYSIPFGVPPRPVSAWGTKVSI